MQFRANCSFLVLARYASHTHVRKQTRKTHKCRRARDDRKQEKSEVERRETPRPRSGSGANPSTVWPAAAGEARAGMGLDGMRMFWASSHFDFFSLSPSHSPLNATTGSRVTRTSNDGTSALTHTNGTHTHTYTHARKRVESRALPSF